MKFPCTVERLADGRWLARHSASVVGTVEVTAASRRDVLEKLQNELQYRIELCPCSGASHREATSHHSAFWRRIPVPAILLRNGFLFNHRKVMPDVTHILSAIEHGEPNAAEQLLPLVYDELRKLAEQKLAQEKPGQTLEATALVHEAYLRLVGDQHFDGRGHFFAAAAEAMRRILVERARRKKLPKHGGGRRRVELNEAHRVLESSDDLLLLDEALDQLSAEDATAVEIVKLRLFAGLSVEEAADSDWWRNLDLRLNDYRDQWFAEPTPREVVPSADRTEASGIDSLPALTRNPGQVFGTGPTNVDETEDAALTGQAAELMDQFFAEV